jgi:hypothetical protein
MKTNNNGLLLYLQLFYNWHLIAVLANDAALSNRLELVRYISMISDDSVFSGFPFSGSDGLTAASMARGPRQSTSAPSFNFQLRLQRSSRA